VEKKERCDVCKATPSDEEGMELLGVADPQCTLCTYCFEWLKQDRAELCQALRESRRVPEAIAEKRSVLSRIMDLVLPSKE